MEIFRLLFKRRGPIFPVYLVLLLDNFALSFGFILFGALLYNPEYGMLDPAISDAKRRLLLALLYASFSFTQVFGAPILGDITDHIGRKRGFFLSITGSCCGYLLSGLSIQYGSYIGLLIGRMATGFFAGNIGICLAVIADLAKNQVERARLNGFVCFFFGLSWVAGIFVGGFLSNPSFHNSCCPQLPFWISAFGSVISFFVIWRFFHESYTNKRVFHFNLPRALRNLTRIFKSEEITLLYISYFLWAIGWTGCIMQWLAPISLEHFSQAQPQVIWSLVSIGAMSAIGGAIMALFLSKRVNPLTITLLSMSLSAVLLSAASIADLLTFKILVSITACLSALVMSSMLTLFGHYSPIGLRGKAMGLSRSVLSLASLTAPLIGTIVAKWKLFHLVPLAALFISTSLIILLRWQKKIISNQEFH